MVIFFTGIIIFINIVVSLPCTSFALFGVLFSGLRGKGAKTQVFNVTDSLLLFFCLLACNRRRLKNQSYKSATQQKLHTFPKPWYQNLYCISTFLPITKFNWLIDLLSSASISALRSLPFTNWRIASSTGMYEMSPRW
ncbi:MAG: hypothetical protein JWQ40_2269 [Segetibacter sp.]|jgi:hypothetical protein|nr:hypothetical protein [Segetibacter sp.]